MKDFIYLSIIGILILIIGGGYFYINNKHNSEVETLNAQISGQRSTLTEASDRKDFLEYAYDKVSSDYNDLVNDYNDLRNSVIKYIGSTNYQARQPITCNSYSYGYNSSSTTCY